MAHANTICLAPTNPNAAAGGRYPFMLNPKFEDILIRLEGVALDGTVSRSSALGEGIRIGDAKM